MNMQKNPQVQQAARALPWCFSGIFSFKKAQF
jgi:hypothetical protein